MKLALLAALLALSPGARAEPVQVRARMAGEFVDSMGVCVDLGSADSEYARLDVMVIPALKGLGINHLRDSLATSKRFIEAHTRLSSLGFRLMLTAAPGANPDLGAMARSLARFTNLEAVEAAPEPDLGLQYKGAGFPLSFPLFMDDLRKAMDEIPATRGVPLVAGAPRNASSWSMVCGLANCPLSFVGVGSLRLYTNGRPPSLNLAENLASATMVSGSRPVFITESGYHDQVSYRGEGEPGIPEAVAGRYIARLWFESFRLGIARTYVRELFDRRKGTGGRPEDHYGMAKPGGMMKPAYYATKNMTALLADPGPAFNPGILEYELAGNASANLHQVLLQKRDARFYLVVWQDLPAYDPYRGEVQERRMVPVMLFIKTPIVSARFYQPLMSPNAHRTVHGLHNRIPFTVPDHPMIIEIVPMKPRVMPDGRVFYPPIGQSQRPRRPKTAK